MKDTQYFLHEEEKYLASPQANPELVWNDEYGEFDYPYDPLAFYAKNLSKLFNITILIRKTIMG